MNDSSTIENCLRAANQQLIQAGLVDSYRLDAELLLAHSLHVSRTYLFTWSDKLLDCQQQLAFDEVLQQRLQGKPIAHILGEREFWGLNLRVTVDTLIPRPDSETLVEAALELHQQTQDSPSTPDSKPEIKTDQAWSILDLGTGSGAIALALKSECPLCMVTAVDFSQKALQVASENALNLQLDIKFLQSDWFSAIQATQSFDCIVSNPPYIEDADPHLFQGDVRFEPITALTSGQDGLDDIRKITDQAWSFLNPNGWLLIEHGYHQAKSVAALFKSHHYSNIRGVKDLGGNPRITLGQKR
ncbi:peptide chain release factor N(5)-glutamine methyltransferase [Thiomicrorhabdus arctica]|uniref:peptide chain release factor N(5)-glutamine methyltransferase n=1 Tax=Thiomicrorhabdus arctica TaxID=131540 RepID=UPI0003624AEE|nr:peptide chain release factor N(5)-glutamine methyltransferase [Thiomicrorhabdus arctica]